MALVTMENIRLCFPELDLHAQTRLARNCQQESGKILFESAISWTAPVCVCQSLIVEVEGEQIVEEIRSKNLGVIFIIPHLGNWELIQHYLGKQYSLTQMFEPRKDKSISEYITSCRARTGGKYVPTNSAGIRAVLSTLKNNGVVGVMPDQEPEIHTG